MAKVKEDAYEDLTKGFGGINDTTINTMVSNQMVIPDQLLARYWQGDGLAKKIVTTNVDDAIRPFFEVEGAENTKPISDELKRLKVRQALKHAFYWARLYGGALICIGYKDGIDSVEKPTIFGKEIAFLKVYPRTAIQLTSTNLDMEPTSPRFGLANVYPVQPFGVISQARVSWHYSRCIEVRGEPIPEDAWNQANADFGVRYWGISCLQGITDHLNALGISMQGVATLLKESAVAKYALHGVTAAMAGGKAKLISTRLAQMQAAKSVINAVILDSGGTMAGTTLPSESFTRDQITFAGIPDVIEQFKSIISGISGYPETKLYGSHGKGLGAKDDASTRNYYDLVAELQMNDIDSIAMEIVRKINAYTKTIPDTLLSIKWASPWMPSQSELTDMRAKQAATDQIYYNLDVLDSEEIRSNRFEGEASLETHVEGPLEIDNNPEIADPIDQATPPKPVKKIPPAPKNPQPKPSK